MATRPTTQLDFDQLKADIINFIKTNPTFTDYNFEGSALNAIADILAYNTHNNAYYANMLHNEGFIDTAQKRSSVVSKAKELGYTPRSASCSTAFVDVNLTNTPTGTQPVLSRGVSFNSFNDNGSYTFFVADDTVTTNSGGVTKFSDVRIINGTRTQNYFKVDRLTNARSIFTIPNKNVDTKTLRVFVLDSVGSVNRTEYFPASNVYDLTPDSKVYFIQESYDGYNQIYFGENILGNQPGDLNIIDIDYFVVENFDLPNDCMTFTFDGTIGLSTVSVVTKQSAFGGATAEDIDSVRYNAIKANSAKERVVTTLDYSLKIAENFSFVRSSSVWGGEDNEPPIYGKVFISLQPTAGYFISDEVKTNQILPVIKKSSMMTVIPEFIDPSYTMVEFITRLKFNPYKTTNTREIVEFATRDSIASYVDSISTFNSIYLESTLIKNILELDPGIVSVNILKKVGFNISPVAGVVAQHKKSINNKVLANTIESNRFQVFNDGRIILVSIKEIPNTLTVDRMVEIGLFDDTGILISNIGTADLNLGRFNLTMAVYSYTDTTGVISIRFQLENDDIITKRNQIIVLPSTVQQLEDSSDNLVITEIYAK